MRVKENRSGRIRVGEARLSGHPPARKTNGRISEAHPPFPYDGLEQEVRSDQTISAFRATPMPTALTRSVVLRRVRASSPHRTFSDRRPHGGRAIAWFRQCQRLGQLTARHRHLAVMHRKKLPALIVSVELQTQRSLAGLVDEHPDTLIPANNGSDQYKPQLDRRRTRRHWRRSRHRRLNHGKRRPPRGREDRSFARLRQCCERDRPERIAAHRLPLDGRRGHRRRIDRRCPGRRRLQKRATGLQPDEAWHVDIRKIHRQRRGRGGNTEQRSQHGREPHRYPPYRLTSSHVPRHWMATLKIFAQGKLATCIHRTSWVCQVRVSEGSKGYRFSI